MTLEVRDLRLVQAVAHYGGLTRASSVLHLTQSALSHQLADLERRLGTAVFLRQGKRMVLTPAGERLRAEAEPVLTALARAEAEIRGVARERQQLLRLSTECYTCYHWLPPVLREYSRKFPAVETRIIAETTRRPMAALLNGQLDVAILSSPSRSRRVAATPLFRDELVAIVPPDHPWAARSCVAAGDFVDQHLVSYTLSRSESTLFQEVLIPAGVSPKQVSQVELTEAIVELVKAGVGIAVMARWAVAPQLQSGALVAVPVTESGLRREWYAGVLKRKAIPQHLHAFVSLLARSMLPRANAPLKLLQA